MKSLLSFLLVSVILALGHADEVPTLIETPSEAESLPAVEEPVERDETPVIETSPIEPGAEILPAVEDPEIPPIPDPSDERDPLEMPEDIEDLVPLPGESEKEKLDDVIDDILSEIPAKSGPPDPDDLEHMMLESSIPPEDIRELYASSGPGEASEILDTLEDLVEEHDLTDEARMLFGLGECGTFEPSTCDKKKALRTWICEFSKHMRGVKEWMTGFIDYKSGCTEADMLGMEMLENRCMDQRDLVCMDPSMRKCLLVDGCQMCRCLDRDDINQKYLLKIWKVEQENYKERMNMYKKVKESCRSNECSEDVLDEGDEMGSGREGGSGMEDDEDEIMYR